MLPQVMFALDRSASMWKKPDTATSTRLQSTQRVLKDLMYRYHDSLRFGYVEFPVKECAAGMCCASAVVPPNSQSLSLIERMWSCSNGAPSCSETTDDSPIGQALAQSRRHFSSQSSSQSAGPGSKHVVLMTDGEPTCSAISDKSDCSLAINEVSALNMMKVFTHVVGLTEELRSSSCLESLATLGAQTVSGQTPGGHSIALDGDKLMEEVNKWLSGWSKEACMFRLPAIRESPIVKVKFRSATVPQDPSHKEGWDYDAPDQPTRITLYGSWCERVRDHGDDEFSFLICTP
jgi:hypothetical protein